MLTYGDIKDNFGICSAAEIFQNVIEQVIQGIPGARNISDNIIIFGSNKAEHDSNLHRVLERLREKGLKLNKDKCVFSKSSVSFYGHIFSENGISPDPKKIEAIKQSSEPKNASEVRSLLGMTSYCARFVPNYRI